MRRKGLICLSGSEGYGHARPKCYNLPLNLHAAFLSARHVITHATAHTRRRVAGLSEHRSQARVCWCMPLLYKPCSVLMFCMLAGEWSSALRARARLMALTEVGDV
jgi:hypothetical protein